jgi:protease IV
MKQFITTIAGVFVGLALFFIGVPLLLVAWLVAASRPAPVAPHTVLVADLRAGLSDQPAPGPFAALSGRSASVMGLEQALRAAARDDRVSALMIRLPEGALPPAAADELRLAIGRFRAAGKPVLAHAQGLYPEGTVISTYELAAASGDVWMQPASSFQATGLAHEQIFFKSLFDRHGVTPDFQQRYEYKNAINPLLFDDFTPAHRESELSWMGSVYGSALAAAAKDRGRPPAQLRQTIEAGPYAAETALARGLIDHVGQVKAAETAILAKAGPGAHLVPLDDYAETVRGAPGLDRGRPAIAVISVEGAIMTGVGGGSPGPFGGAPVIRSDDVEKAFHQAIDDADVKAIVFRISSPGGSDTASEQILDSVRAAKAAGKPVVVSMGTYAASGGYWIASQASEIVAEPSTLTGSIGVFGGKFALGEALSRFGVDMRGIKVGGDYADAFGARAPMSPAQRAAFSAWMDGIYDGFVRRVAQGRRLPEPRVRVIARGRVWTGAQARGLGLVDRLGGFYDAVDRAKQLAGIRGEARLQPFTVGASPLEALRKLFGGSSEGARLLAGLEALAADPAARALGGEISDARLRTAGATVLMPRLVD